jgi:KDO2-lipid IV(A) lauroyltransferase
MFRVGADRATRRGGDGIDRLAENLRQVVGPDMPEEQFQTLVRDGMRSYARYWCDAFRLPSRTIEEHAKGFRLRSQNALLQNAANGQGSVLALSHSGNWDAAGAWVAAMNMPITTVAERLKPEVLYERFLAYRRALGMEILPLTGGDQPIMDVLADRIQKGAVVPLLADRDFTTRGVQVRFFGGRTRMPPGPAILALRTGAPLHVVTMWYEPDGPVGRLSAPLVMPDQAAGSLAQRVRIVTQMMADEFQAGIAEHPQDWHMLARMFIPDRPAKPVAAAGALADSQAG